MRGKISKLVEKIQNLNGLLNHSTRIGEKDISRKIREEINTREKELRVLRVQSGIKY